MHQVFFDLVVRGKIILNKLLVGEIVEVACAILVELRDEIDEDLTTFHFNRLLIVF